MKIIDNFLPEEDFKRLQNLVMYDVPWFFQNKINDGHSIEDNTSYFTHILYNYEHWPHIYSEHFHNFKVLSDKLEIVSLMRMKLNLYTRTEKTEMHVPHTDYKIPHKGCILSFNTCNGGTILFDDNEKEIKVDSVENRALLFDPSEVHSSLSCTDAKARWNVNINYF
jgi:hypothetical protein